jgi:hypothetical protein
LLTDLKESLDVKHKRKDVRLFGYRQAHYIEEDVFTYFYPFCLINTTIGTGFVLRKNRWWVAAFGMALMASYNFVVFAFPVEAIVFHRRALRTDLKYA